jgi:hypothetical protein
MRYNNSILYNDILPRYQEKENLRIQFSKKHFKYRSEKCIESLHIVINGHAQMVRQKMIDQ